MPVLLQIVLLLLLGLLLLLAEAFLPGGVAGLIGAGVVVASAVLCYSQYGVFVGTLYLLGSLALAATVAAVSFTLISRRLTLGPPEASPEEAEREKRIGAAGRVVKPIDPTGTVEIGGKRYQARSRSSEEAIAEGQKVVVVALDSTFLVVRPE